MPSVDHSKKVELSYSLMILGGLSMLSLGGVLGFLSLMVQLPVAMNSAGELSRYLEESVTDATPQYGAYFLKGSVGRANAWERPREQLLAARGEMVELTDAQLNAWFNTAFRPAYAGAGTATAINTGVPNIYFSEQRVYLSLPIDVSISGSKKKGVLFLTGEFVGEESCSLQIHSLYINNAPLPFASVVGPRIVAALLPSYSGAEDYSAIAEVWGRIESIQLGSNRIQVQMR